MVPTPTPLQPLSPAKGLVNPESTERINMSLSQPSRSRQESLDSFGSVPTLRTFLGPMSTYSPPQTSSHAQFAEHSTSTISRYPVASRDSSTDSYPGIPRISLSEASRIPCTYDEAISSPMTHSSRSASPGLVYLTPNSSQASLGPVFEAIQNDEDDFSESDTPVLMDKATTKTQKNHDHKITEARRRWDHKTLIKYCIDKLPEKFREFILYESLDQGSAAASTKNVGNSKYHGTDPAGNANMMVIYAYLCTVRAVLESRGLMRHLEDAESERVAREQHLAAERLLRRKRPSRSWFENGKERAKQERADKKAAREAWKNAASTSRASGQQAKDDASADATGGMSAGRKRRRL